MYYLVYFNNLKKYRHKCISNATTVILARPVMNVMLLIEFLIICILIIFSVFFQNYELKLNLYFVDIKNNSKLQLTESFAVYPASSVTGWYFSHPDSKYFSISRISDEQLDDYSERKNINPKKLGKIFPHILEL